MDEEYSRVINGIHFNHNVYNNPHWEEIAEDIANYLDRTMTMTVQNNSRIKYYNKFSACSKKGFQKYLLEMPHYLLLEIMERIF